MRGCQPRIWKELGHGGGFPGGSMVNSPPANAGDADSIPGSGRFPELGNGNPLQYSCLETSIDRGAWRATVHGVAESDLTEHPPTSTQNCITNYPRILDTLVK